MMDDHIPLSYQLFSTRLMEKFGPEEHSLSNIRVLDLGCGTGEQIVYMHRLGFQMSGCDISREFVEATLTGLHAVGATSPDVRLSIPTALPFETDQFHAVYANGVFEHCPEMPSLIAEVARVLIPKGVFLAGFPLRSGIMEPHLWLPFVHWFAKGRMQRLLIRTMNPLFRTGWSLQGMERYLQNEVFYWTSGQVRQILHRYFEETNSLAKEYLMIAKHQVNQPLMRQLGRVGTAIPLLSSILEHLISWQWSYLVEVSHPIKKHTWDF